MCVAIEKMQTATALIALFFCCAVYVGQVSSDFPISSGSIRFESSLSLTCVQSQCNLFVIWLNSASAAIICIRKHGRVGGRRHKVKRAMLSPETSWQNVFSVDQRNLVHVNNKRGNDNFDVFLFFCVIVSWSSSLGSSTTGLVTLALISRQRLWNKHIQCLNLDLVDGLNFYFQRNAVNLLTHGRRMMNAATHTRCQQSLFSFIEKENPPTIICCERRNNHLSAAWLQEHLKVITPVLVSVFHRCAGKILCNKEKQLCFDFITKIKVCTCCAHEWGEREKTDDDVMSLQFTHGDTTQQCCRVMKKKQIFVLVFHIGKIYGGLGQETDDQEWNSGILFLIFWSWEWFCEVDILLSEIISISRNFSCQVRAHKFTYLLITSLVLRIHLDNSKILHIVVY